jgi:hypothetical protein
VAGDPKSSPRTPTFLASNPCSWHQIHAPGIKSMLLASRSMLLASNPRSWHQIHAPGIKSMLLASNPCNWHQIHAPGIKSMLIASNPCSCHQIHATVTHFLDPEAVNDRQLHTFQGWTWAWRRLEAVNHRQLHTFWTQKLQMTDSYTLSKGGPGPGGAWKL